MIKKFQKAEKRAGDGSRTTNTLVLSILRRGSARPFGLRSPGTEYVRGPPARLGLAYRAAQHDCDACMLKPKCCPIMLARKIARSVHEAARDKVRAIAKTEAYAVSCRERKKVWMLFAHLKRILRLGRLRLRGPDGAKDEFLLAATAQNLRKLAKLIPLPAPIFAT